MPTPNSNSSKIESTRPDADCVPDALDPQVAEGVSDGPRDVPRPIGPERLRKLRESIENGTYPSEDDVIGGLERLFRGD